MSKIKQMLDNLFNEKREFSRFEACYDLVNSKGGIESLAKLAKRWQWSKAKVQRFLVEMTEGEILKKVEGKYQLAKKPMKKIERIEVLEVIEQPEPKMEMAGAGYQVPMFSTVTPQREGVPPTKEQAFGNGGTFIDLSKVDWKEGMQVPLLRFYKRYLDANPHYVVRENDHDGLKQIIKYLEDIVRTDMRKRKIQNHRFNKQMLKAVDFFNEKLAQTFYGGWDIKAIADKWNQVTMATKKIKKK